MPTTLDLVANVTEKKPSEFQTNFASLVTDRIRDLVAAKRIEVAKNLFGGVQETPEVLVPPEVIAQAEKIAAETGKQEQQGIQPEIEDGNNDQTT